jgi:integrase
MPRALNNGRLPKLRLPARQQQTASVFDQTQRLDTLRQLLEPDSGHLQHRVAAVLLVLLGQPFTKIAALRVDDIAVDGDTIAIRLGHGDTPIPPPFSSMVGDLLAHRRNLNTATNPTSVWLFPGRNADRHVVPGTLSTAAIKMGINLMAARTGALRQLVLDCPPTVVADALGYSYQAIDRHALRAGSPRSSYAALKAQTLNDRPPCAADS